MDKESLTHHLCTCWSPSICVVSPRRFALLLQLGLPHSSAVCSRLRPPLVPPGERRGRALHQLGVNLRLCWRNRRRHPLMCYLFLWLMHVYTHTHTHTHTQVLLLSPQLFFGPKTFFFFLAHHATWPRWTLICNSFPTELCLLFLFCFVLFTTLSHQKLHPLPWPASCLHIWLIFPVNSDFKKASFFSL